MAALAWLHHSGGTEVSIGEGSEPVSQSAHDRVSPITGRPHDHDQSSQRHAMAAAIVVLGVLGLGSRVWHRQRPGRRASIRRHLRARAGRRKIPPGMCTFG